MHGCSYIFMFKFELFVECLITLAKIISLVTNLPFYAILTHIFSPSPQRSSIRYPMLYTTLPHWSEHNSQQHSNPRINVNNKRQQQESKNNKINPLITKKANKSNNICLTMNGKPRIHWKPLRMNEDIETIANNR